MDNTKFTNMFDSDMWQDICDFYHMRIDLNHPSWVKKLFFNNLDKNLIRFLHMESSVWILRKLKMDCNFTVPVDHPLIRLFIADYKKIYNVARYCGIALCNVLIRTSLQGGGQKEFKLLLGERDYNFAVNTVPLLLSSWPPSILASPKFKTQIKDNISFIYKIGINAILSISKDLDDKIIHRVKFKLPIEFKKLFYDIKYVNKEDEKLLKLLINKIIRMIEPTCVNSSK
jgi:hypothetical protein